MGLCKINHGSCHPIFNFLSAKLSLCQQQSPLTSVVWSPSLGGGAVPQLLTGSSLEPLPPYSPTCNPTTFSTTTYCDSSPHICYSPYRSSLLGYLAPPLPPPHISTCEQLCCIEPTHYGVCKTSCIRIAHFGCYMFTTHGTPS